MIFEIIKWAVAVLLLPLGAWIGSRFSAARERRRRRIALVKYLMGLPPEAKSKLIDFHKKGTHTMRGDPGDPANRLLIRLGVMTQGPGGGTYYAIDSYLSIRPVYWEVMDDWLTLDEQLLLGTEEPPEETPKNSHQTS